MKNVQRVLNVPTLPTVSKLKETNLLLKEITEIYFMKIKYAE